MALSPKRRRRRVPRSGAVRPAVEAQLRSSIGYQQGSETLGSPHRSPESSHSEGTTSVIQHDVVASRTRPWRGLVLPGVESAESGRPRVGLGLCNPVTIFSDDERLELERDLRTIAANQRTAESVASDIKLS